MMRAAIAIFAILLAACSPQPSAALPVVMTPAATTVPAATAVEQVRAAVASDIVPIVVAMRDDVQTALPPVGSVGVPVSSPALPPVALSSSGLAHIVRWEITSKARYNRALRWPIWPGGASGVTWCIGYDGGHQTERTIRADWRAHPQVNRLADTSGLVGTRARDALPAFQDIDTAYQQCIDVFHTASEPAYMRSALLVYGESLRTQPQGVIDALFANTYNRGGSMLGTRNREKRVIRDECLPAHNANCVAEQLRLQKRLWPDVAGLQDRRESEAALAEGVHQ